MYYENEEKGIPLCSISTLLQKPRSEDRVIYSSLWKATPGNPTEGWPARIISGYGIGLLSF